MTGTSPNSKKELLLSQLSLDLFFSENESTDITRSLSVYDLAPKFVYENALNSFADIEEKGLPTQVSRTFSAKGEHFEVTVEGANIIDAKGKAFVAFPSTREEIIESILRKLAISGSGINHDGKLGVLFSVYEISQELSKYGHTATYNQIETSIEILRKSSLIIKNLSTGASWAENIFPQMARGGWIDKKGKNYQRWFVSFHKLVTDNIVRLLYRDMNYPLFMKLPGMLHRYLFIRMVNLYTYAASNKPYQPTRNQILTESGRGTNEPSGKQTERVNKVLKYMQENGIIERWDITEKVKEGRRITNVRYDIYPTQAFINDVIDANKAHRNRASEVGRANVKALKSSL